MYYNERFLKIKTNITIFIAALILSLSSWGRVWHMCASLCVPVNQLTPRYASTVSELSTHSPLPFLSTRGSALHAHLHARTPTHTQRTLSHSICFLVPPCALCCAAATLHKPSQKYPFIRLSHNPNSVWGCCLVCPSLQALSLMEMAYEWSTNYYINKEDSFLCMTIDTGCYSRY